MTGFVYLWLDAKRKKYYLGSHMGPPDDGYTGSNKRFLSAYKSRPHTFKRRILESHDTISSAELRAREQKWLNLIEEHELHGQKYYNEKRVAAGGDIYSSLPEDKKTSFRQKSAISSKKYWDNISADDKTHRQTVSFGGNKFSRDYLIARNKQLCSKTAIIKHPNGSEECVVNIAEFCERHSLNYGNLKSVLRGTSNRKTCSGFSGKYAYEKIT